MGQIHVFCHHTKYQDRALAQRVSQLTFIQNFAPYSLHGGPPVVARDLVPLRNDPRGAAARRRPAYLLCSRRPQHPCASTEPAHGLGRGRSAENGSVDWRPAALRGAVPRRRTGLGRAAPEAGEGQQAGGRRGSISGVLFGHF